MHIAGQDLLTAPDRTISGSSLNLEASYTSYGISDTGEVQNGGAITDFGMI